MSDASGTLRLTISMGDPAGIGPEVVVKTLASPAVRALGRFTIHGAHGPMLHAARLAGITPFWTRVAPGSVATDAPVVLVDDELVAAPDRYEPDSELGGRLSFSWVLRAMRDLDTGHDACITAPISKLAWSKAGHGDYPGHTELFAAHFNSERYAMFFHAPPAGPLPGMNVILATVHVPQMQVARHLTTRRVIDTIELAHETMTRLGVESPSIGVCGLNPHAGEGGLLGTEDLDVIAPAVAACRDRGLRVAGPLPADTIFQKALSHEHARAAFDVVAAMYHDQGLVALKTLAWDRAVNMTVGLRIVRTSPDHGTAFDIAGRNAANPGSMIAAVTLAARMASSRR
jgi:4-hydroxythreonine-4-phosphate dehydrogenase